MARESRRVKRMKRHYARNKKSVSLNIVALIDIFTVMLFFLIMYTDASTEIVPINKSIKLPESISDQIPKENILIVVNTTEITIQGMTVADTRTLNDTKQTIIDPVLKELNRQKDILRSKNMTDEDIRKYGITIMGDKEISFQLLKRIMTTAGEADFSNISLAVLQKSLGTN